MEPTYKLKEVQLDGAGTFEGWASVYDSIDDSDEVIGRGAFGKSLRERGPERPLLLGHDRNQIVGKCWLAETSRGLALRGQLDLTIRRAQEAYSLLKSGALRGLSVGFKTLKETWKEGRRYITEAKLYEVSLTAFPCAEDALVTSVKTSPTDDRAAALISRICRNLNGGTHV